MAGNTEFIRLTRMRSSSLILMVIGMILCSLILATFLAIRAYRAERDQTAREAGIAVEAFSQHTVRIVNEADVVVRGVRTEFRQTGSVDKTVEYIGDLALDHSIIADVFIVGPDGRFVIPDTSIPPLLDRDYFLYHQTVSEDSLYITSVDKGRLTGKYHFRFTRRLNNPDGSFGGVVIVTVKPQAFARYFRELKIGPENVATLVGTHDFLVRARIPEPADDRWSVPIDTGFMHQLIRSGDGLFEGRSPIDGINRYFTGRPVPGLPLYMIVGFSAADIRARAVVQWRWLAGMEITIVIFLLILSRMLFRLMTTNRLMNGEIERRITLEAEREKLITDLQATIAEKKILSGLLPICASCKKIRDDGGYWNQIESYIHEHSSAEFSHSLCPDCVRELYPEISDQILRDIDKRE